MHGSRRVITFCLLTTVLPSILIVLPLYLRNIKYADVLYKISESDVIQIHKGQSSVFCEKHSLKMNYTFNAFQMRGKPELSDKKKHIRLRKSMTLPDDTLEYWGFYLFKGATVELKACSRHEGSKILVVKGDKILDTCGILDGNNNKKTPSLIENQHVLVTLENPSEKNKSKLPKYNDPQNNFEDSKGHVFDAKSTPAVLDTAKFDIDPVNNVGKQKQTIFPEKTRKRRDIKRSTLHNPNTVLDAGVNHGGNAFNSTVTPEDSAVSSFENNLHECYQDNMLMSNYFPYSMQCNNTKYLEKTTTLKVTHEVLEDGYYYYIFYSDNDIVMNDIHAIFDIYKPTFQYVNMSDSKRCVNKTECEFDVGFFSDELVIVEVPTEDGLKNDDESSILVSVCHPRISIYIFFPISVLLLILLFAFL